jgi:hypothetical protein
MDLKKQHKLVFGLLLTFLAFFLLFQPKLTKKPRYLWSQDYLLPLNAARLNRLLRILQDSEVTHKDTLDRLGIFVFGDIIKLINGTKTGKMNDTYVKFQGQISRFMNVENRYLVTNEKFFADVLTPISDNNSFYKPRNAQKLVEVNWFVGLNSETNEFVI